MIRPLILLLALLATATLAYWRYTTRVVPAEVALNAADIDANGSQDNLRKGYHQRRSWARLCPLLAHSLLGAAPAIGWALGKGAAALWWAAGLAFLAVGMLLAGYFARYFTPLLNVAMKLDYKPEFYASPDSASWPDAAVWKQVRDTSPAGIYDRQPVANDLLKQLLTRTWLLCRLATVVLGLAAAALVIHS